MKENQTTLLDKTQAILKVWHTLRGGGGPKKVIKCDIGGTEIKAKYIITPFKNDTIKFQFVLTLNTSSQYFKTSSRYYSSEI